jgi:outer membrane protein OmpA-like peptidoglycan-associated protein
MLLAAPVASAEPLGRYFTITPFGGFTIFDGSFRYPNLYPITDNVYAGGRLGWQYDRWLGLEAAGGFTPTHEDKTGGLANPANGGTPAGLDTLGGRDVDYWHFSGNLMFTPWPSRYASPFLFLGGGYSRFQVKSGTTLGISPLKQGNLEYGGGVNVWLTDQVGLRLEARDIQWIPGDQSVKKTHNLVLGGGITFAFGGKARDTDGDGVPDRKDKCPDTPHGAKVDENGCPLDSDGDKVFDGLDKCPNTPHGCTVDANGCPSDQDGDGVCDGLDQCPDTPKGATVDAKGCPADDDGDGVLNGLDKCPGTPKGCKVDSVGCPHDSDGDGVCDGLDKCPDTPAGAQVSADGCPVEVIERETELLDTGMIRLHDVNFETGKSDILPDSYPVLDVVGQVLAKWPELKIEVGGHTDSRGKPDKNQKLSEDRANAVLAYIVKKFPGLQPTQYTVRGYGATKPIAPNTSAANMAKNRRVEFVVQNKDVLKRESQRRRLLQKSEATTPAPAPTAAPTAPAPATVPGTPAAPGAPASAPTTPAATPAAPVAPAAPAIKPPATAPAAKPPTTPAAPDTTKKK